MTFSKSDTHEFTGSYDIAVQKEFHLELWCRDVPLVAWKRLIRDQRLVLDSEARFDNQTLQYNQFDATDQLYREQVLPRYHPAIFIRVFIQPQGDEQTLTKLGIVESRPATAKVSTIFLESMNIPTKNVRIGDILEYNGHEYTIDKVVEDHDSCWLNSNIPFILLCKLSTIDRQGR
jgi:hypothetical protein